jgi:hypothetical protein
MLAAYKGYSRDSSKENRVSSVVLVSYDVPIAVAAPVGIGCGKVLSGLYRTARCLFVDRRATCIACYYRNRCYRGFRFGYWRRLKRKRAAQGDVCQAREEQQDKNAESRPRLHRGIQGCTYPLVPRCCRCGFLPFGVPFSVRQLHVILLDVWLHLRLRLPDHCPRLLAEKERLLLPQYEHGYCGNMLRAVQETIRGNPYVIWTMADTLHGAAPLDSVPCPSPSVSGLRGYCQWRYFGLNAFVHFPGGRLQTELRLQIHPE